MAVAWSRRAEADLREIFSRIAVDNRPAAERWVARLMSVSKTRAKRLFSAESYQSSDARRYARRTCEPIASLYRADETGVCVLTLFEGSRLLRRSDVDEP